VFEHDVKPLRWLTRRARDDILVRLVDDTGQEGTEAKVYRCDLDRPLEISPLALDKVRAGLTVAPPGSLFYAEHAGHAGHNDTVAVSNVTTEKGLQGLGFSPKVGKLARNTQTLSDALRILARWQESRLSGFLIKVRHRQVVDAILDALYGAVCGQNWADAETRFRNHPHSSETLEILKSRIDKRPSFAVALIRNWSSVSADPDQRTHWFTEVAARYRVCNDRNLCEFALRLASQPQALSALPFSQLDNYISQILNYPATLRGARLLALLSASDDDVPVSSLPRWQW